jgi:phosphate transport system permease protein
MLFATPLGIGSALYISELAPSRVRAVVKPAIELLAGIPSVVLGFFGLIVLTNWIRIGFDVPSGESWLAGSLLLGVMALPTIISVSEDAISAVPREFREGSLAVGATHWQTISRVVVPSALSGITAAFILGMGRAIGETMAVMMVTGNAAIIPNPITDVLSPVRTLTGTLGIEMGEVAVGSQHYHALFGVAVVLLCITLIVNVCAMLIMERLREGNAASVTSHSRILFPDSADRLKRISGFFVIGVPAVILLLVTGPLTAVFIIGVLGAAYVVKERLSPQHSQTIAFGLIVLSIITVLTILGIILFVPHRVAPEPGTRRGYLPCDCRNGVSRDGCDPVCPPPRHGCRTIPDRIHERRNSYKDHPVRC